MLLSQSELESLVQGSISRRIRCSDCNRSGTAKGLVARAMIPGATRVELVPVHDTTRPKFELKRIGDTCVFEGITEDPGGLCLRPDRHG